MKNKKILILGVNGMLGHKLFFELSTNSSFDVFATVRDIDVLSNQIPPNFLERIRNNVDANNIDTIIRVITEIRPDVVVNCIGIIKQLDTSKDPITAITINSLFPHRLANVCKASGVRMIHFSTDCVFDGSKGNYVENDSSNATDLYGRTKFLGEVIYPHCVTLRTSIIGHELKGKYGLIEWFLTQKEKIRGFTNVIFSGLTTIEMAHVIGKYVIPDSGLKGLYHVSSNPISKYNLLELVKSKYEKQIEIEPFDDFRLDRSIDSSLFKRITGYTSSSWQKIVDMMYQNFIESPYYKR